MRYSFVIEWIDGELERLQQVRQLLVVSSSAKVERAVENMERTPKARSATGKRRDRPPGSAAKPKAFKSKPSPAGETRALTANYPLHPVVVAPAQSQPEKPATTPREEADLKAGGDGTLESLLRGAEARHTVS